LKKFELTNSNFFEQSKKDYFDLEKLVNKRKSHYKMIIMHEYKFVSNHLELIEEQEYNSLNSLKVSELEKMREEKLSEENCWQLKRNLEK
jgi:hypothetical protein